MDHIHKRFTGEQVKNLFRGYCQGFLGRVEIESILGVGKARFFALLRQYRQNPEGFSITYKGAPQPFTAESLGGEGNYEGALFGEVPD